MKNCKGNELGNDKSLPKVLVMMATYNGEIHITEQIESILAQKDVDVYLWISDDCSSDKTSEICQVYVRNYPNVFFSINKKNKGLAKNFMDMVYASPADRYDYFAFSDQDDYWLPNKLREAIKSLDSNNISGTPALYYSDVLNVDEKLHDPEPEYYSFRLLTDNLKTLLMCNYASGCTMVFNKELNILLKEHYVQCFPRIHDAWVHLVAATCGKTYPDLGRSFIYRRISGNNQVGKRGFGSLGIERLRELFKSIKKSSKHELTEMANIFLESFSSEIDSSVKATLEKFMKQRYSMAARLAIFFDKSYKTPYSKETLLIKLRILFGRG